MAQVDSLATRQLDEVTVKAYRFMMERMSTTMGTRMFGNKKNEVIQVQSLDANISEKTPRQIFAKVPGVFVYDMDGTGNQTNISTRGLDPHRGWEFNIRENGNITNSDMYGYPASHFSLPMEAIDRIELVRGTGSLQYGAQFGGLLNYVTRKPDTTRAVAFESINAIGSFGLLSTHNAIGGTLGKFQYYAYFNKRVSDGYRDNGDTDFDTQSIVLIYHPTSRLSLKAEVSRSNYVYHIPGPLTDSMFHADPRQSTRSRNYFNPEIYVPSFSVDWKLSERTHLSWVTSAVLGTRSSVQFDKPANVQDAIDPITLQYAHRQVDIDNFNSYTSELRLLQQYRLGKLQNILATGVQLINNDLHRQQVGKGTTGSDFDLTITDEGFGRDLHLKTKNIALFAENRIELMRGLVVSPGVRLEIGNSEMIGVVENYDSELLPTTIKHHFPLFGLSANYTFKNETEFYAGWSQAYRPVTFKDIIPTSTYDVIDDNLKDAFGYNLEAGYRGSWNSLRWDVNVFQLQYNNRLGTVAGTDADDSFYILRTNIGNSVTNGAEVFVENYFPLAKRMGITVFTATSFMNARYQDAHVRSGENNIDVSGNQVESVPHVISRNGMTLRYGTASVSLLYSYTAKSYADALNTERPSATGAVGLVPSYGLLDLNTSFRISNQVTMRFNINNVTDKQYFTKRPQFYPGPGVWSSDGRAFNCSIALAL